MPVDLYCLTICQAEIQALYATHRVTRNQQQRDKFLAADFGELIIDPFLLRIEKPEIDPSFSDPRNCLVFWARPPDHVVQLAVHIQGMLKEAAPSKSGALICFYSTFLFCFLASLPPYL